RARRHDRSPRAEAPGERPARVLRPAHRRRATAPLERGPAAVVAAVGDGRGPDPRRDVRGDRGKRGLLRARDRAARTLLPDGRSPRRQLRLAVLGLRGARADPGPRLRRRALARPAALLPASLAPVLQPAALTRDESARSPSGRRGRPTVGAFITVA